MKGKAGLSNTLQALLLLCNQALGARWGVRLRVRGNGDYSKVGAQLKAGFYKVRKMAPEYETLTLLSTSDPEIFMIIKRGETNGTDRLENDYPTDSTGSPLGSEEIL